MQGSGYTSSKDWILGAAYSSSARNGPNSRHAGQHASVRSEQEQSGADEQHASDPGTFVAAVESRMKMRLTRLNFGLAVMFHYSCEGLTQAPEQELLEMFF